MNRHISSKKYRILLWFAILSVVILTACAPVQAQGEPEVTETPSPATIELSGVISEVSETEIIVNNLTILTTTLEDNLDVGMRIEVIGVLLEDGQIQATQITILDDNEDLTSTPAPEITPEVTSDVTPHDDDNDDDDVIIVIEGPVQAININIIVIYGFEIEVNEDDLILTVLQIGDVIRVEGRYNDEDDDDERIRLIAINITVVSVTIVIIDNQIWRDTGSCTGIPAWVPEDAIEIILIRCQGGGNQPPSNGGGRGGGDNDDDD